MADKVEVPTAVLSQVRLPWTGALLEREQRARASNSMLLGRGGEFLPSVRALSLLRRGQRRARARAQSSCRPRRGKRERRARKDRERESSRCTHSGIGFSSLPKQGSWRAGFSLSPGGARVSHARVSSKEERPSNSRTRTLPPRSPGGKERGALSRPRLSAARGARPMPRGGAARAPDAAVRCQLRPPIQAALTSEPLSFAPPSHSHLLISPRHSHHHQHNKHNNTNEKQTTKQQKTTKNKTKTQPRRSSSG